MKGYIVCVYKSIENQEKLKEYAIKARAAVEKYKGKLQEVENLLLKREKNLYTVLIEFHHMTRQMLLPIKRLSRSTFHFRWICRASVSNYRRYLVLYWLIIN